MLELVSDAVERMREAGTDLADVEAKRAVGGFPSNAIESVCAFANTAGGLLLLGIDENNGFGPVEVDAATLASDLASQAAQRIQPPIRPTIEIVQFEGRNIVAAVVEELPRTQKPAFLEARGMGAGSFIRTHDGDRRLTPYEVQVLLASRGQPTEDESIVAGATPEDLDASLVAALIDRLRRTRGPAFADRTDTQILRMVGVLGPGGAADQQRPFPTVAGLLALGRYPQQFLPQLDITFIAYPTITGEPAAEGTRFLDNASIEGPIPVMLLGAAAAIQRNIRRRSVIDGLLREDRWEYPEEAIREVLANALMHRDLSSDARGAQIRVELYPDRLEIISPGGLHGPVDPDALLNEPVSSSRNARLAKLLEDVVVPGTDRTVVENRGSGLLALAHSLRAAGMEPPELRDSIRDFRVRLRNSTLLDDEALRWLGEVGTSRLSDAQRLGAAFAKRHGRITNSQYRTLAGVDAARASRDLAGLADVGLLRRMGDGRGSAWVLPSERPKADEGAPRLNVDLPERATPRTEPWQLDAIRDALREGPRSTADLAAATGIGTPRAVLYWLKRLEESGQLEPTSPRRRSPGNRWQLLPPPES